MKNALKKTIFYVLGGIAFAGMFSACASVPAVSPVYAALQKRPTDLAQLEALAKVEPNAKAPDGNTCLYHAIVVENFEAAEVLAANGARLTPEELYALFEPYKRNASSKRYRFLAPAFPDEITTGAAGAVKRRIYKCVSGDTAMRIARKLNCTEQELRDVNPDVDFTHLRRGQSLNVPLK